jgi:hypothetical protein
VIYEAAGRQRKAINPDMSLGSPTRQIGVRDSASFMTLSAPGCFYDKEKNKIVIMGIIA